MKNLILALFISLVVFSQAGFTETVYKGKDADGNVLFSDKPLPDSEKIEIKPAQTYTPAPLPKDGSKNKSEGPAEVSHYEVSILEPANDQTMTTDIQSVRVSISVRPELQKGDKVQLFLNGKPFGQLSDSLNFALPRLDRGSYEVKARVVSEKDPAKVKGESAPITFFQRRTSVGLFLNKLLAS